MAFLARFLTALPLLIFSPLVMAITALALAVSDLWCRLAGRPSGAPESLPRRDSATVVIPNWNGKDLLERYLPSIETALAGHEANEILVVDNGSTDGSADMLRARF